MYESGVLHQMEPIEDWAILEMNTDVFAYEEDIRYQFFEAGAAMYELEQDAEKLVEYILLNQTGCPEEEADLFIEHGDLYEMWSEAHHQFVGLMEAWEILANDDILRWHPYYAQYRAPRPEPAKDDTLWTSPAPPNVRPYSPKPPATWDPEDQEKIEVLPYPGQWADVFDDKARRLARIEAEPSGQPNSSLSSSSGPEIPPWVIPYGQEPDMGWQDIDWHNCTTIIEPPMSPKTLPCEGVVHRVMPPKDSYMSPRDVPKSPTALPYRGEAEQVIPPWQTQPISKDVMPGNLFSDQHEAPWNDYSFTGTEKLAEQEFLHVPSPVEDLQTIAPNAKQSLKRKSEEDLDGEIERKRPKGVEKPAEQAFLHAPSPIGYLQIAVCRALETLKRRSEDDLDGENEGKKPRICTI
uniref:Uncharacterized protein n=1 Tax=Fusarium oxysporum (strain Fo5176) TaxID=660025 RepID=A0A0D2XG88_FUSOF